MAAKLASSRRAPPRNAFLRLRQREVSGHPAKNKIFTAIPARLASPVATLVDAPRAKLLECVLLGFTADGEHLVSYAALDGARRYELQIWTFRPRTRCELVASVPLFSFLGAFGGDARDEDRLGGDLLPDFADAHLRITVCESADGSTLLVHGEPAGGRRFGDTEAPMARRCFLTAVPSPAFFSSPRGARARPPLGATSMSYLSTSARPFDPRIAGCVPVAESGESGASQYAVLNAGDALIGVRVAPASADDDDPPLSAAGPVLEALPSVSEGPTAAVRWALPVGSGSGSREGVGDGAETAGQSSGNRHSGNRHSASRRRVASVRSWTAAEADAVLTRALAATLRAGYCLVDYEVHLLDVAHGAEGAQTSAVAAVVSVLRARRDDSAQAPPRRRHPASGSKKNEGWRTVVSVVEIPLGRPPPPPPRLLFSVEVPPAPPRTPHHAAASAGGPPTLRAVAAARARLASLRRAAHVPAGAALRAGATLSNAGAVATGMSAAALKHPTQPVCVVGWNG